MLFIDRFANLWFSPEKSKRRWKFWVVGSDVGRQRWGDKRNVTGGEKMSVWYLFFSGKFFIWNSHATFSIRDERIRHWRILQSLTFLMLNFFWQKIRKMFFFFFLLLNLFIQKRMRCLCRLNDPFKYKQYLINWLLNLLKPEIVIFSRHGDYRLLIFECHVPSVRRP